MAISFVQEWDADVASASSSTLSVSPVNVGDAMVFAVVQDSSTAQPLLTSVTGGGVTTWRKVGVVAPPGGGGQPQVEIWWGVVTATGSQTITANWNGTSGNNQNLIAAEFHESIAGYRWLATAPIASHANGSSTSITYPTITSSYPGDGYYVGMAGEAQVSSSGSTGGFTYAATGSGNEYIYGPVTSGVAATPVGSTSAAGASNTGAFVLWAAPTSSQVTLVQSVAAAPSFGTNSVATQFGSNTTTGNTIAVMILLIVIAGGGSTNTITSVTDGTNTYTIDPTSRASYPVPGTYDQILTQIAYATNIVGATTPTVTVNCTQGSVGSSELFATIAELTPSRFSNSAGANGTGTTATAGSYATPVDGAYGVVSCGASDANPGGSPGSGWIELLNTNAGSGLEYAEGQAKGVAGTITGNVSLSGAGSNWAASMATFVPPPVVTKNYPALFEGKHLKTVGLNVGDVAR